MAPQSINKLTPRQVSHNVYLDKPAYAPVLCECKSA
jgi:hypothetical protein